MIPATLAAVPEAPLAPIPPVPPAPRIAPVPPVPPVPPSHWSNISIDDELITIDGQRKRFYVVVTGEQETSVENVFAAGDVSSPLAPTISGACGAGATAAKVIASRLTKKT